MLTQMRRCFNPIGMCKLLFTIGLKLSTARANDGLIEEAVAKHDGPG